MTTMRFGTDHAPAEMEEVIDLAGLLPPGRKWAVRFVGLAASEDCVADENLPLGFVVADCARRLGFARAVICSSALADHAAVVVQADSTEVFYRTSPDGPWDSYVFDGHPPTFDAAFRPSLGLGIGRPRPQIADAIDDGPRLTPEAIRRPEIRRPRFGLSSHPVFRPREEPARSVD